MSRLSAVEANYQRLFPMIREKCARMLSDREEARDVAQETFIRLWQSGIDGDDPRRVTAWIYRTATRLAIDRLRSRRRAERAYAASAPNDSTEAHAATDARIELERIAKNVPARELELAILHRIDGLTHQEAAEVAQISDRTVRRMLERFDARLAELGSGARP